MTRRRAIGAEPSNGGTSFRVWAPAHERVSLVLQDRELPLQPETGGYFSLFVPEVAAGTRYHFRLDDGGQTYPDPASRFQPEGPHGASEVIDPRSYSWHDASWRGVDLRDVVVYEMHVGTFTTAGTHAAAIEHLAWLAGLGITVIELMPLSEFPGAFGWGYDGVDLWAPSHLYGTPDDLRRFVDAAHQAGLAVILDVVYNHFGPDGCFLREFTSDYFTDRYENEWGDSINFDGDNAGGVREFFIENASHWIDEYHFDGLRLDATQSIFDRSPMHVIQELTGRIREVAGTRRLLLVGENEPQEARLVREMGLDALWNDDWHHTARVALTGSRDAYYHDYRGTTRELAAMLEHGFLYQGQHYSWQKKRRGTPSHDLPPERFVCYLQNHDQIANSARGARLHQLTSPALYRAMTALLLLQPQTPHLFQGQEFSSSAPFLYFADHEPELARRVAAGRKEFLTQFASIAAAETEEILASPADPSTFERCKIDHRERESHSESVALHRDLLALRRESPFRMASRDSLHTSPLGDHCLIVRWFAGGANDRILLVNLGPDLILEPASEPLLAPPDGFGGWEMTWHSEALRYGGSGTPEPESEEGRWSISGQTAIVLSPRR